ncbi:hypothetical protein [Conexibacter woesei]|uniref:Uncharacterized protein n=1 Tax=Conexibacter woesei (strain DSM 14684 / CCUG 47730 / CIP 108061 / JCM 11494 / NBRC 100937 / ID131577) TaxID=469383 RepID=D3F5W4_CONWI|nr:hypothetical protein [Conexibacter woesei]ADB52663.1 hypothetical protein Cwoe_4249 [Conexibacter woesei DSM 14684]
MRRPLLSVLTLLALPFASLLVGGPRPASATSPGAHPSITKRDAAALRLQRRAAGLVRRAGRETQAQRAECRQTPRPPATFTHATPSEALRAALIVMRRPPIPADNVPEQAFSYDQLTADGVYADWIRLARAADAREFYVVPAQREFHPAPLSRDCLRERHSRLLALLDGASADLRRAALRIEERVNRRDHPPGGFPDEEVVTLFERGQDGTLAGGTRGGTLASLRAQGVLISRQLPDFSSLIGLLLPDGVETIELFYAQRVDRGPHRPAEIYPSDVRLTLPVQDNVASFRVPRETPDVYPTTMIWRAVDGSVVRTVRDARPPQRGYGAAIASAATGGAPGAAASRGGAAALGSAAAARGGGATVATASSDAAAERQERRSTDLINAATRAMQRDPACRQELSRETTFTHAAPSAELLGTFELLRRPAIPQDRIAEDALGLRMLGARGVYLDWIRMARAANGREHYLVVAQDRGLRDPLSRACLRERHRQLMLLLDGAPPRLRRMTLRDEARLNREEHPAGGFPKQEAIYHFERGPDGQLAGGGGGVDLDWFRRHGLFGTAQDSVTAPQDVSAVTGFVPDGVRTIEATFAQRADRGRHRPAEVYPSELTLTVPVQDNIVSFNVARQAEDAFPTKMVWRATDGSVVRIVREPR